MFTGIVRELGRVQAVENGDAVRLLVEAPGTAAGTGVGDSVALNGVCLTATEKEPSPSEAIVMLTPSIATEPFSTQ